MNLEPMNAQDYEFWSLRSRMSYAQSKMKAYGTPKDEAVKLANSEFARLLPDGRETKDHFLYSAFSENVRVGFVWLQVRGTGEMRRIYVCDIVVEPDHRGKGHGEEIMLAVEKATRDMGLKKIGLHVFGYNEPAIALYKKLGYLTTDLTMEKTL